MREGEPRVPGPVEALSTPVPTDDELLADLYSAMGNALNGYRRPYYGPRGLEAPEGTTAGEGRRQRPDPAASTVEAVAS